ncbi:DUF2470 domain-containing protein [Streptomyces radicis]|uniref:DUF2470 domain-containing protein n=1 Tax=Streptomyces radicis TaxID=1750517 RepID=A0A3A9WSY1_9ACTN|nr:DUF2470 domain-containing protein [Streptomyces radicis]RKN12664.1 DUF2470 domain-containing protein [Streptomyces radicis]RKN27572.1 DUF2470 domain-containing protein [Streptomyces radicis]
MTRFGVPAPARCPGEEARGPSAAERVRTLVESNSSAVLSIPEAEPGEPGPSVVESRAVAATGDLFLLVPDTCPAARAAAHARDDEVTAVMEITDIAPVAVPHRVRGRGWVAGWLTVARGRAHAAGARLLAECGPMPGPGWSLLRLEAGEAYIDDLWGSSHVEPDELAEADPDPLARYEAELLQHLATAHGAQLRSLCALLDGTNASCAEAVTPLCLDRFGLRVRFRAGASCFDARFEFPAPVGDIAQLRRAMRQLFEAASA